MVQSFDLLMRLKMEFCVGTFNSPFASRLAQIAKKIEFNRGRWLGFFYQLKRQIHLSQLHKSRNVS